MSMVVDPVEEAFLMESPYAGRKIKFFEHVILAAYWFGSNFIWGAFLGPVLASHMTSIAPQDSARLLGQLYAIGAIPALLIPLIIGPLSDRCTSRWGRRRPFILIGGVITLIGIGLLSLGFNALSLSGYIAGYFVLQIGANTALGAYSGVIPDLVPADQRGIASGFMAVMSQLSTLFGALIGGMLVSSGHNSQLFIMLAVVFAVFVGISLVGIKEKQLPGPLPPFSWRAYFKSLWIDPRKHPDFAWVWVTRALMMFGFYAISPFILYYLRDIIHVEKPASTAGLVFGLILLAATISGYVGGLISDKIGRKSVVTVSSLIIAAMSVVFIFLGSLNAALVAGVVFGLGYGAYVSVDWALGADVLPDKKDAGKDMAVWHISMTLPQQIAPLISGSILAHYVVGHIVEDGKSVETYGQMGYAWVFGFAAIAFFLSGVLVKKVKGAR